MSKSRSSRTLINTQKQHNLMPSARHTPINQPGIPLKHIFIEKPSFKPNGVRENLTPEP